MEPFNISYVVDDQDPAIQYLCSVDQHKDGEFHYNGSQTTTADPSCGNGWFQYKFNGELKVLIVVVRDLRFSLSRYPGTGVHVSAPMSKFGQQVTVKIDDAQPIQPYGMGIWDSGELADGKEHTLIWAVGDNDSYPEFDYLTVTAGPSTSLHGRTLVLDDSQHGNRGPLSFQGSWTIIYPPELDFNYTVVPLGDTVHWSNQVGDTMSLEFIGEDVYFSVPKIA
jgi:hypothetical protein